MVCFCHPSRYLLPRGEADIFFPTDFELLSKLAAVAAASAAKAPQDGETQQAAQQAAARAAPSERNEGRGHSSGHSGYTGYKGYKGRVVSNAELMGRYADVARARTLSGFNPLLDDFKNTRVFLT